MEDDEELVPAISSSPLFGEAHREHLLSLYTKKPSNARRRFVVAVFGVVYFCIGASSYVLAPFFPLDAYNKGANGNEVGLIFGIFALTNVLIAPLVGSLVGCYDVNCN